MVPNTTCSPSKKLSPMMITIAPPVVQPSLGLIALMHGVAKQNKMDVRASGYGVFPTVLGLFVIVGANPCSR